jgi:hypothetical protein
MVTIKSYTDLSQSKKLAEILPLESADMYWYLATKDNLKARFNEGYNEYGDFELPCWSTAALLRLMPKIGAHEPMLCKLYYISEPTERYICQYSLTDMTSEYDNPIDACYEMILKLKEQNLL